MLKSIINRLMIDPQSNKLSSAASRIDAIIRVNQAGELGAAKIYEGQLAVFGTNNETGKTIKHMAEQEIEHRKAFDKILMERNARPTLMTPLWSVGAYMLGASTALLGKEAAMLCTVAVEDAVADHYNDQLRVLHEFESHAKEDELRKIIAKFRDDEIEHRDVGLKEGANEINPAILRQPIYIAINKLSKAAIWITARI